MESLIQIVIIGLIIYCVVIFRKKSKKKIMESPQYQIYLEALEAVKSGGYEIEKKNSWQSYVKRGSVRYGLIFVVDFPKEGFLSVIMPRVSDANRSTSNYEIMRDIIQDVNNSHRRGQTYWPNDSLVGGFTTDLRGYTYDENWIRILESVI